MAVFGGNCLYGWMKGGGMGFCIQKLHADPIPPTDVRRHAHGHTRAPVFLLPVQGRRQRTDAWP